MQHNFVFNHLSLPAVTRQGAYALLLDTMKGMLAVGDDNDRYAIFADHNEKLNAVLLSENYSYDDFLDDLAVNGEEDLQLALLEVEDKTPMFNHIPDSTTEAMLDIVYYFPDQAYTGTVDILGLAWNIDAIVLSLATDDRWRSHEIKFSEYPAESASQCAYLPNISTRSHGILIRQQREELRFGTLEEQFSSCKFAEPFLAWYASLHDLIKARVREKLKLATGKNFSGGKPLFDTLTNADGIREMRFSNVEGGAIRILFKPVKNDVWGVLTGFIKKSNSEGYDHAITVAKAAFKEIHV